MAAQILSRAEVSTLISTALDEVYEVEGKGASSEAKSSYAKFMDVKPMDRGQFINYRLAGFGQHAQACARIAVVVEAVWPPFVDGIIHHLFAVYRVGNPVRDDNGARHQIIPAFYIQRFVINLVEELQRHRREVVD